MCPERRDLSSHSLGPPKRATTNALLYSPIKWIKKKKLAASAKNREGGSVSGAFWGIFCGLVYEVGPQFPLLFDALLGSTHLFGL